MKILRYIILCGFYFFVSGCVTQITADKPEEPSAVVIIPPPVVEEPKIEPEQNPTGTIPPPVKEVCTLSKKGKVINITIKDYPALKFLRVKASYGIDIGLRAEQANDFLRQAKDLLTPNTSPLMPFLFRAVSKQPIIKPVAGFWIQEKTINPQLYKEIISNQAASTTRISHENAEKVIGKLNDLCKNKVKFTLPTEEQFVHLARKAYDPVTNKKLKSCKSLKGLKPYGVKKVFGHNWQLTSSYCRSLDPQNSDSTRACDSEQSYVKKGGSVESRDATECMPEYRAESTPDMGEPNTTFRLVLTVLTN